MSPILTHPSGLDSPEHQSFLLPDSYQNKRDRLLRMAFRYREMAKIPLWNNESDVDVETTPRP